MTSHRNLSPLLPPINRLRFDSLGGQASSRVGRFELKNGDQGYAVARETLFQRASRRTAQSSSSFRLPRLGRSARPCLSLFREGVWAAAGTGSGAGVSTAMGGGGLQRRQGRHLRVGT